jgi:hypothetical protein
MRALAGQMALGELTLIVLSWPDPAIMSACRGVGQILTATDYMRET